LHGRPLIGNDSETGQPVVEGRVITMKLNDLQPAEGSRKKARRSGRGISAGRGKTAGRGTKGQNSRSGGGPRPYFEGGQLPLVRRLPHLRGFTNIFRVEYTPINLDRLNIFDAGTEVALQQLVAAGLIKSERESVKILGNGDLDRALTVKAHKFSASAREKILAAGGQVEELPAAA
jgi:large subunit ribosomal protein L15